MIDMVFFNADLDIRSTTDPCDEIRTWKYL